MTDLLTIAIPIFNRDAYLRQALESALNQTCPVPVIVVDNASDKGDFQSILRDCARPNLKYHRNERNLGCVGNWNRCLELCTTPYLLILHDDDYLELDYVARFVQYHQPGRTLYWGQCAIIDQSGKVTREEASAGVESYDTPLAWCLANPAYVGIIFDCAKARALAGFRPGLKQTPDWDLWFRLFLAGPSLRLPGRAGWYREYHDAKRETTRLQASPKHWFYVRNQIKRNFSYIGGRATYLEYRRARRLPGGNAGLVLRLAPQLSPRLFNYFIKVYTLSPPHSVGGKVGRLLLRFGGRWGFKVLRWLHQLRSPESSMETGG